MSPSPHPLLPDEVQAEYLRRGLWSDQNLLEILDARAAANPSAPLYLGDREVSYGEAANGARRLAAYLQRRGVGPGATVVAPLVSGWEATVVVAAVAGLGAQLAPLPSRASRTQVRALIDATHATALVVSGRVLGKDGWKDELSTLTESEPFGGTVLITDHDHAPGWAADLAAVERVAREHEPVELGPTDSGAPFLLLSTGGTTGPSKVVMHSGRAAIYAASQYVEQCALVAEDRVLSAGPFGHASGTVFTLIAPIVAGASVLPITAWDAAQVSLDVARHRVTWALLSGTHIYDLLQLSDEDVALWASVRGLSAGSGSDERYAAAEKRLGFHIRRMYGLTECMGHAVMPVDAPDDVRMLRDGLPFDGIECYIEGDASAGEYLVRGPSLMLGYYGRPDQTADAVTSEGYLRTGDVMSIDDAGYVRYVGRVKDVIRRGGVNIDPLELERVLVQHPDVLDVTVVGMPSPRLGEQAVAVVIPRPGANLSLDQLNELLRQRDVPRPSHPEGIVLRDDLPKTEFGKHNKTELKKQLAEAGITMESLR